MSLTQSFQDIAVAGVELLVIALLGFLLGRVLRRVTARFLFEAELDTLPIVNLDIGLFLSRGLEYAVYIGTIVLITNRLGVTKIALIAIVGVILVITLINVLLHFWFSIPNLTAREQWKKSRKNSLLKKHKLPTEIVSEHVTGVLVRSDDELLRVPYSFFFKS